MLVASTLAESSEGIGATSGTCGASLTWEVKDGALTITGTGTMKNYTSPSGAPWESVKSSITTIVVASGATTIGDYAFYGCTNLTSISLPSTVKTIGNDSLASCSKLASIILPSKLTSLGEYAFSSCGSLRTIKLPSTLKTIGQNCFSDSGLRSITIPDSVEEIGRNAFYHCNSLEKPM